MPVHGEGVLTLSKHEGAGNDFLVLLDPADDVRLSSGEVRLLCDRHKGIGADGLIRVTPGGSRADVTMELRNADGGGAATSGNGLRCLAQAVVDSGWIDGHLLRVATASGVVTVDYEPGSCPGTATASVGMGPVRLAGEPELAAGQPAQRVDVGNPHLVVRAVDPAQLDVVRLGAELCATEPGGINVEFIAPGPRPDELVLRVFERGVGETLACGSGSCAAAAVARAWGLVGRRVVVHNPGGPLEVDLGDHEGDSVVLGGPVRRVGHVEVPRAVLA
jgi:diaminopimelate epimerase